MHCSHLLLLNNTRYYYYIIKIIYNKLLSLKVYISQSTTVKLTVDFKRTSRILKFIIKHYSAFIFHMSSLYHSSIT